MIVMTCRNNLELSKKCFASLLDQTHKPSVLVVDNASTDGTAQWLRSERVKVPFFYDSLREPISVSHMWNSALEWAWGQNFQEALVVNNDTELLPETWEFLRGALEASGAGMVTCVSVREREKLVMPESPVEMTPHPDYSCFMIAKWAHERVKFDENCLGAFYEDNVHHVEMHRAGIKALNVGVPFLHHGSMTMKTADKEERERIEGNAAGNREYFKLKFGCYPGTKAYERLFT